MSERKKNRKASFDQLANRSNEVIEILKLGPQTQQDMARALNKHPSDLSAAISYLLKENLIYQFGTKKSQETGRPQTVLHFGPSPTPQKPKLSLREQLNAQTELNKTLIAFSKMLLAQNPELHESMRQVWQKVNGQKEREVKRNDIN